MSGTCTFTTGSHPRPLEVLVIVALMILSQLPSLGLTSHAVIKNWNVATTVQALGSVTALTPSDKESLANDCSPVSGKSSAWLRSIDSKRQLPNVDERSRVHQGVLRWGLVGFSTSCLCYYLELICFTTNEKKDSAQVCEATKAFTPLYMESTVLNAYTICCFCSTCHNKY